MDIRYFPDKESVEALLSANDPVLVLIDYYLLGERNFLFCLPMLAVAFFILLHRVMQD